MKKHTASMWLHWIVFMGGLALGYVYRTLPVVTFYGVASLLMVLFWNGFVIRVWTVPTATITDGLVFTLGTRMLGMLWRGDKNPLIRKLRVQNFYE